ncbi:STAS-like domain-containing protein [Jeongeupia chitinilytica]|uniref:DUF4325 domain-containing protein n=1 Tax=Jeongeupia chitinilytica TaxID=1041641 RepID=A0ABQ3GW29_9NEIS|nr:DUF4325 domain-containing protein [Jeongeupia chitinilytica]GHD57956.1 hypothetical protein GCM10007350_07030 [Jeongeupia chitinilytica]
MLARIVSQRPINKANIMRFKRRGNIITPPVELIIDDLSELSAAIYSAIDGRGYQDITIDFERCVKAEPEFMLALCAISRHRRGNGIDINIKLPKNEKMRRLFVNTNWAHHISPDMYPYREFFGYAQVPATYFSDSEGQYEAVSKIVDVILTHVDGISKNDFAAFEWAANEMTDNVLVHSNMHCGFVQVSKFRKDKKKISLIVCDVGIGIPDSLRSGVLSRRNLSDENALAESIKEGITRDKNVGQGNGLFGSHQICTKSGGMLKITSGYATLYAHGEEVEVRTNKAPFNGTLIVSEIDFSTIGLLENALKFDGKVHEALSRIESMYEDYQQDILRVKILGCATSFGSRASGFPVRSKIKNLMDMSPGCGVEIDFSGVPLMTSSFADEVVGKLLVDIGGDDFFKKIRITGLDDLNKKIVNRSLAQRHNDHR